MTPNTLRESWNQPDERELQSRLSALPGNQGNTYEADEWFFLDQRKKIHKVPFNIAVTVLDQHPDWVQALGIDLLPLIKQLWLGLAERTGITNYLKTFRGLLLWVAAMARSNLSVVTRKTLPEILQFRLTHSLSANGVYPTRELSSNGSLSTPSITRLHEACDDVGLPWFGRDITDNSVQSALKKLIPEFTGAELTYKDWMQGGSYNLLTLDHGRYYVEHCLNVFEEHAPLAIALHQTQLDTAQISQTLNIKPETVGYYIRRILEGQKPKDIDNSYPDSVRRIQRAVMAHFRAVYLQTRFEHELLQEGTLEEIAGTFGLTRSVENVDRLRVIIWDWFQRGLQKETEQLLNQCQRPVSWASFQQSLESVKARCDTALTSRAMPTPTFFKELGFCSTGSIGPANQFIAWVAKAGLTGIVALTGWRSSEFGFPWSAVQQTRNTDKLDEYAFPFRYQVDWYVYKTNGRIKTLRETTFSPVTIFNRLRRLNNSGDDLPCLYSTTTSKKDPFKSEGAVEAAIIRLWPHFVEHYPDFKLLDDITAWHKLAETEASEGLLAMGQLGERERLLTLRSAQEWDTITVDENLRNTWHRVRSEWPRMSFIWTKRVKSAQGWVVQYRQGILRPDWSELLDSYLSEDTRQWLFSLSIKELTATPNIGRTLANEVMADAIYPTPHAFRHMWAESVYRRFDGDAGWMIRSQFKHISQHMWLAYIRDKDNRFDHQRAKLAVTHSLVANFLNHKGEAYAGQMSVLLRRLSQKTRVLTTDEQKELAAKLATQEIENLKANPWGYCLLMRRSRHKAQCAEGGEPMRHNASPELCLGCIHNLMQANNVEWMILHVSAHIEALKNPIVPNIFKKSSYELVRNTTRHVRKLDPYHEALPELEAALTSYKRVA